ncbi:MAG: hypothetical protein WCP03_03270 [Candidatus Saccharibacteria bacterium]
MVIKDDYKPELIEMTAAIAETNSPMAEKSPHLKIELTLSM